MKKRVCLAVAFAVLGIVTPEHGLAGGDPDKGRVVLKGLDPVSLLAGVETPGIDSFAVNHGPFRYLFMSAEHRALFEATPNRYAVQGEGKCTVMPKAPASPDLFLVHEGRIFLFGSPECKAGFQANPSAYLKSRKNVAILIYDGVELLDFAGPGEVFTMADNGRAFNVYTVAADSRPVSSQGFVTVTPRYTLADCPKPDVLILPGGATRIPSGNPAIVDWVRKATADAEIVISVCTGAFLLAKAGLLDGLQATTHSDLLGALRQAAPRTVVREARRFVDNGKVVTSAGVSAGIDASLHVVSRLLGLDAARATARVMEYRWEPEEQRKSK